MISLVLTCTRFIAYGKDLRSKIDFEFPDGKKFTPSGRKCKVSCGGGIAKGAHTMSIDVLKERVIVVGYRSKENITSDRENLEISSVTIVFTRLR